MRAVTYQGKYSVSVENVEDPTIQDTQDVIVKITDFPNEKAYVGRSPSLDMG